MITQNMLLNNFINTWCLTTIWIVRVLSLWCWTRLEDTYMYSVRFFYFWRIRTHANVR